jgi:Spy/CpxP family protein refolding chaperone
MSVINKDSVLAMVCGMVLSLGCAGAMRGQQGAGSASAAHPTGSSAGTSGGSGQSAGTGSAMSADTPEADAALNLTDEQKAQIAAIREDGKAQIATLGKDASLSDEAKQQKLKVIRKEIRRQVWSVMTPEQQKQWAAEQRELREHKHSGGGASDAKPQNY